MSHDEQNPNNRDEVLVDYLENDIELPLKKDMDLVLEHSSDDRRRLRELKITKLAAGLAASDIDEKEINFNALHDKIMGGLDKKLDDNVVVLPVRRRLVPVAAAVALVVLGSLIVWGLRQQGALPLAKGDIFVSTSASDLEAFSDSLINNSSDSDFFIEVAARKMDSLPHDETASLFDQLKD